MIEAHGLTILHGSDVVVYGVMCAIAAVVMGGIALISRLKDRRERR